MKINKKQLGSSVRRGALVGTFGGFLAGWLAFAAHAVELPPVDVSAEISYDAPAPVPAMPTLRALPTQTATAAPTPEQIAQAAATGQPIQAAAPATPGSVGKPAGVPAAPVSAPVAPPAAAPVFVPAPPVPKTVVKPAPITAPSKKP